MSQRPLWTYFVPRWVRVRWMTRRLDRAFDRADANRDLVKAALDAAVETIRREAPAHVLVGDYQTDLLADLLVADGVLHRRALT